MTHPRQPYLPPCIVDVGTIIRKNDIYRILADLGHVWYVDIQDGQVRQEGEGYVMEVYDDPQSATIVFNRTLYLNVSGFDYLTLSQSQPDLTSLVPQSESEGLTSSAPPQAQLDLVQENRILRLLPLSDPLSDPVHLFEDTQALKAAMSDALTATWETQLREDEDPPCFP